VADRCLVESQTKAGTKVVFFAWTALREKKILTIETCQKGDRWQHNPTCPLCQLNQEDTSHLLEYCAQEAGRIPWRPVGPIVGSGAVVLVFPLLSAFVFVLPAGGLA
jgi:hypothetical protein